MKAAAAVLAASLLFFLGVLTGAGRRGAVPPPGTITLGVVQAGSPSAPAGGGPSSPASPARKAAKPPTTTKPASDSTPTTAANPSTAAGTGGSEPAGDGSGITGPAGPSGETTTTTAPAEPSATSTTAPPGQVQQVDNQVDCAQTGKRGKGHRTPCPSTTTTSATSNGN
jgi:hypothetical protein